MASVSQQNLVTPSIHLLSLYLSEQGHPDFPLPRHLLQLFREDPKVFPGQLSDIVTPACPGSSLGSPPGGMPGIPPEGPSHLSWLLSMWRSSGSTPSSSQVTELLALTLRERPATLRKKLGCLYPGCYSFSHDPKFMAIGEGRKVD